MMTVVAQQFLRFDFLLLRSLTGRDRRARTIRLNRWVSKSADGQAYPIILTIVVAAQPNHWRVLSIFLISFAIELTAYKLVKQLVRRPRPFHRLDGIVNLVSPPDFFSFPSGHTAGAMVAAVSFISCYPDFAGLAYAWVALVGFSRVYLGVHYPTDVLAGAGLGILSAKAGAFLASWIPF